MIIIGLFLCIAVVSFVMLYKKIQANHKLASETESQWQAEIEHQKTVRTLVRSVDNIKEERERFETHFAKSSDIVPFLDTIEGLAEKASAKATIDKVDITADPVGLLITIHASGSFESIYKFMRLLENSSYELAILDFELKKSFTQTNPMITWEASLTVNVVSFINK
jgi:hypothetical protein